MKKRIVLAIAVWMCSFLLFGSMDALAFCYTATPNWSKSSLSNKVTFTATTIGGIEARGYYVFAYASLRTGSGGVTLATGGMKTSYVVAIATSVKISSSATYDNSQAKVGYAEYGISSDKDGVKKVEGMHIEMEYANIY